MATRTVHDTSLPANPGSETALDLTQPQNRALRKRDQSRERQRRWYRDQTLHGRVKVSGMVTRRHAAAIRDLIRAMEENPECEPVLNLRDPATGRFVPFR